MTPSYLLAKLGEHMSQRGSLVNHALQMLPNLLRKVITFRVFEIEVAKDVNKAMHYTRALRSRNNIRCTRCRVPKFSPERVQKCEKAST